MLGWLTSVIASASASIVFLTIFLVGLTSSLFSLVFGGDEDASHDAGDGDVHVDGDHDGGEGGGDQGFSVSVLSVRGMSLLATGFGGVGLVVYLQSGKLVFSTIAGFVVGYGFAFLMLYLVRMLKKQQANSIISMDSAIGSKGVIVTSIPVGGLGEVRLVISGVQMTKMCVAKGGKAITSGTSVQVEGVNGGTIVVSPVDQL